MTVQILTTSAEANVEVSYSFYVEFKVDGQAHLTKLVAHHIHWTHVPAELNMGIENYIDQHFSHLSTAKREAIGDALYKAAVEAVEAESKLQLIASTADEKVIE